MRNNLNKLPGACDCIACGFAIQQESHRGHHPIGLDICLRMYKWCNDTTRDSILLVLLLFLGVNETAELSLVVLDACTQPLSAGSQFRVPEKSTVVNCAFGQTGTIAWWEVKVCKTPLLSRSSVQSHNPPYHLTSSTMISFHIV